MKPLRFTVPGPPVGKQRTRSGIDERNLKSILRRLLFKQIKMGQAVEEIRSSLRHHTPKKTRDYEKHVRACAEVAVLSLGKQFDWPTSRQVFCDCYIYCSDGKHGDASNIVKSIEDACAGVLWISKNQKPSDKEVLGRAMELTHPNDNPRVDVVIQETGWDCD